jgi:hypothetical protein
MNKKRLHFGWIGLALILASGWLYTGCQTTPSKYASSEAGFLISGYRAEVKNDPKAVAAANTYAQRIAEEKLRALTKGESLADLRRYKQQLEAPIQVSTDALGLESSLSASRRQTIVNWLNQHPECTSVNAAKVSVAWQQEIERTDQLMIEVKSRFDAAIALAREKMASKSLKEAAQQCRAAVLLDPENLEAQALLRDIHRAWALDELSKLTEHIREVQNKVALQTRHYESDLLSEPVILECETTLNQAMIRLDGFRAWADPNPDTRQAIAEREQDLRQMETQLAESRGILQAQRIWLMRHHHQYWAAYQYFLEALAVTEVDPGAHGKHRLQDYEIDAIRLRLRQAYERMLPDGMTFYMRNAAAAAEGHGANGLSLILCRLAQELYDCAETEKMQLSPEVETLRGSLQLTLGKAQDAIRTGLARQLIVKDFQSEGEVGRELASRIYAGWLGRYGTGALMDTPVPVWQVEIKRNAERTGPLDYVLSGAVSKCYSDATAPKELSAERIQTGMAPKIVPNPDKDDAKKNPTVYEQEIWIYERRISVYTKKATILADISLAHDNKSTVCSMIDEEFDGVHKQLPGIRLTDQEIQHHAMTLTLKRSRFLQDFKTEELPPNKSADLSPDRDIQAALIDYAKESVLTNLLVKVAAFPLDNLFDQALHNEGNPVQSGDYFGQCLEYCSQLATLDKKLLAKTGGKWPDWRDAVGDRIASLKQTEWRNADPRLTSKIDHLWELSVAAAIMAADEMSRENGSL